MKMAPEPLWCQGRRKGKDNDIFVDIRWDIFNSAIDVVRLETIQRTIIPFPLMGMAPRCAVTPRSQKTVHDKRWESGHTSAEADLEGTPAYRRADISPLSPSPTGRTRMSARTHMQMHEAPRSANCGGKGRMSCRWAQQRRHILLHGPRVAPVVVRTAGDERGPDWPGQPFVQATRTHGLSLFPLSSCLQGAYGHPRALACVSPCTLPRRELTCEQSQRNKVRVTRAEPCR